MMFEKLKRKRKRKRKPRTASSNQAVDNGYTNSPVDGCASLSDLSGCFYGIDGCLDIMSGDGCIDLDGCSSIDGCGDFNVSLLGGYAFSPLRAIVYVLLWVMGERDFIKQRPGA